MSGGEREEEDIEGYRGISKEASPWN